MIDLFDGGINLVEQGNVEQRLIQQLDKFLAGIISREFASEANQHSSQHQSGQTPVPVHFALSSVAVREFAGQKKQKCIRYIRDAGEDPQQNQHRRNRR